jgi:hypothetical protein
MELIVCFGLAVSIFVLLIVCIFGLVSAPTPILLGILLIGIILTQKSINKFTEPEINLMDERDKSKVEKVEIASQPTSPEKNKKATMRSMVYRGSNYKLNVNGNKAKNAKAKVTIKYRGVKL